MIELDQKHKNKIKELMEIYGDKLKKELSVNGEWYKERHEREKRYKKIFSRDNIKHLSQKDLEKIIKGLWATQIWGNKDYFFNKLIEDNGLEKIKRELYQLLYSDKPISERFERFRKNIKGLGVSSITEILVFVFPEKYCLWNDKPKTVLPRIGFDDLLPKRVFKYQVNGDDYIKCNEVLRKIMIELKKNGIKKIDFVDLDIFLWLIFNEIPKSKRKISIKKEKREIQKEIVMVKGISLKDLKNTHTDIEGILLEIGNMLGYKTYTPDKSKRNTAGKMLKDICTLDHVPTDYIPPRVLNTVKQIDVIWFDKNMLPKYCFEVEHTTGLTKGLQRLYQIRLLNPNFFIIAPKKVINKFKIEIKKDPYYEIEDRFIFRSYEELIRLYNISKRYNAEKALFLL